MTSEEILQMKNVTPVAAGIYLGMNQQTIRYALQQNRAPFGFAVQNPNNGRWRYHISPAALVNYKEGHLSNNVHC